MTLLLIILILLFVLFKLNNKLLKTTNYNIELSNLPEELNGFKIVQIADLHNTKFGKEQKYLIKKVKSLNPDIVVFTGDLIDYNRYDNDVRTNEMHSLKLLKGLSGIPMYMVYGNHETKFKPNPDDSTFMQIVQSLNVKLLDSKCVPIIKNGKHLNLFGVHDPYMFVVSNKKEHRANNYDELNKTHGDILDEELKKLLPEMSNDVNVLICHRPELLDVYSKYPLDLVLTGHAHGGQFRLPFIGGLYAPHQGRFPKYTSGVHYKNNTGLIVSRGLGNSTFPFRLFNRPEIVSVTLKR